MSWCWLNRRAPSGAISKIVHQPTTRTLATSTARKSVTGVATAASRWLTLVTAPPRTTAIIMHHSTASSSLLHHHHHHQRTTGMISAGLSTTAMRSSLYDSHRPPPQKTAAASAFLSSTSTTAAQQQVLLPSQWPVPMVESHGDYRQEAWIEDYQNGAHGDGTKNSTTTTTPLYQFQKSLPHLPIPSLQDTKERFLSTVLPLARNEQEKNNLLQATNTFIEQSVPYHERLIQRQQQDYPTSSWLQRWWNTWGYLQVRDSIVINVSYFFHFMDDPTLSTATSSSTTSSTNSTTSSIQIQRAASLLTACAQFRQQVITADIPAEVIGKPPNQTPLCSVAYKYMFHACRIPRYEQDSYCIYDPSQYKHVIVVCHGQFFTMDFINDNHEPYPLSVLENGLQQIIKESIQMKQQQNNDHHHHHPLLLQYGWLTSQNRDDWANHRMKLIEYGGISMEQAIEKLQSGAILLCLDDTNVISRQECAELLLHGGKSSTLGYNRWYDKSIQIVVTQNGKAGLIGEHSMMDGMPVLRFANHLVNAQYGKQQQKEQQAKSTSNTMNPNPKPIFTHVNQSINPMIVQPMIDKAKGYMQDWANQHEIHVQSFHGYGSDFMKQSKYSPDAFVQVAMQLATYRLFGEQVGTYEASQVRPFLHGRTETTRSVSMESAAFCQLMGLQPQGNEYDPAIRSKKLSLFQNAVNAHVKYIGLASKAQGVDRHFLGLSMCIKEGEVRPDLFQDPVFLRAKRWRVSTSHLTHPRFDGWGYGEVVPDGVGLAYSIHTRHCLFNICALKEHQWSGKLYQLLEEALLELRTLVEMNQQPLDTMQSKL